MSHSAEVFTPRPDPWKWGQRQERHDAQAAMAGAGLGGLGHRGGDRRRGARLADGPAQGPARRRRADPGPRARTPWRRCWSMAWPSGSARVSPTTRPTSCRRTPPLRRAVGGARLLVGGEARRIGDTLVVDIRLDDRRGNLLLWSSHFERPASEAGALGDQVAAKVADVVSFAVETMKDPNVNPDSGSDRQGPRRRRDWGRSRRPSGG
ncbi:MAG: hypothetical protein WDN45_18760 [Caulobacteraceae bacterium]